MCGKYGHRGELAPSAGAAARSSSAGSDCRRVLAAAAVILCVAPALGVPDDLECAWRHAALGYGKTLQPTMSGENAAFLLQSLNSTFFGNGGTNTGGCFPPAPPVPPRGHMQQAHASLSASTTAAAAAYNFHVSTGGTCSDDGPGSDLIPFCSLERGIGACRAHVHKSCAVIFGPGVHRVNKTIELSSADSGLVLLGGTSGKAIISGATRINSTRWQQVRTLGSGLTLWKTVVAHQPKTIDTLLVDGVRAIQARYPNADPELDKFPIGYVTKGGSWLPPAKMGEPRYIDYPTINRTSYRSLFKDYRGGIGGQCGRFTPPFSYWCANTTQGGGAAQYVVPSGLTVTQRELPHLPYAKTNGAIVTAWRPGHWSNWGFRVGAPTSHRDTSTHRSKNDTHTQTLHFELGGFQGARGNQRGAEWFISNVIEELDAQREFFYDESSATLMYVAADNRPPAQSIFEHALLDVLINISATKDQPATDITISGLGFTGTATTFLAPHGVPSGGDWALQRTAALFFQGTDRVSVDNCVLQRLDGNALMLSGYNQHAIIANNTFLYTGASNIALWGSTSGTHPDQPLGTGPDGTAGDFPRYTLIESNFMRYLGIHEKQSSCVFQAKSAQSIIRRNLCFDVPRAGFNFNDGFGGGNNVSHNLLFQTCGESGDHGAINTWDRVPFLTTVATGKPSFVPAINNFHHNFIVSDGDADGGAIDNDDGSSFYVEHHNFAVYGGAKMGNIDGHAKVTHHNVYVYPNVYGKNCFWNWPGWFPLPGFEEGFHNNVCIMDKGQNYITLPSGNSWHGNKGDGCLWSDPKSIAIHVHDNKVYAPNAEAFVSGCSGTSSASAAHIVDHTKDGIPPAGCAVFNNTDSSGGNDLCHGPSCINISTVQECIELCARNCACAAGVWGRTGKSGHKCYIKSLPAHHLQVGAYDGNTAFTCTPTCSPPPKPAPPPPHGAINFSQWVQLGIDPGSTIAEVPSTTEIIAMGMAVLNSE